MAINVDISKITGINQVGNSYQRKSAVPLDYFSLFNTKAEAETYAASNPVAYVGQVISYTDNGEVKVCVIADAAGTLREVGTKPVGDGKSIAVSTEGIVSILGADTADSLTLPRMKEDKSGIEWVPVSQVVEGDGNDNTTYEITALTKTSGEGESQVTETYGISVKTLFNGTAVEGGEFTIAFDVYTKSEADAKFLAKADYTPYNDTEVRNLITGLTDRVDELDEAIGDTEGGLVKDVADNAQAILDEADAREQGDADTLATAKTYTDEQITGLEVAIEKKENVDYIVIKNKTGEEVASVDASAFVKDSFLENVVYEPTTGDITFSFVDNTDNKSDIVINVKDLVDTYTAGTGLNVENNKFSVDTTVIATVDALNAVRDLADAAQTAGEVASAISTAITNENLGQYAKTTVVETELGKKLDIATYNTDKATFAIQSEVEAALGGKVDNATLADYYTAAQVNEKGFAVASEVAATYATKDALAGVKTTAEAAATQTYVETELAKKADKTDLNNYYTKDDVYTKGETDAAITAKITSINGGESAGEVKAELVDYRDAVNAELWGSTAGSWTVKTEEDGKTKVVYTPAYGATSRIDTLEGEVTNIKAKDEAQDKSIADNAAAIKTHGESITNIQNRLDSEDTGITVLNTRLAALETEVGVVTESRIDGLEGSLGALSTTVGEHTTAITSLGQEDARLAGLITGNTNKFADYSTTAQMNEAIAAAITGANLGTYAKVTDVEAIFKAGEGENPATGVLADEIARAKAAEEANTNAISAIVGEDSGKTIRTIAIEEAKAEVAALVGEAPEALDTIHEIASWIKNDETGAAAMSAEIAQHSGILAGFGGEGQPSNVMAAIATAKQEAIDAIPALAIATAEVLGGVKSSAAENKIAVGADGTMEVNSMNVNKLVQTEGDTLILNGGSAN